MIKSNIKNPKPFVKWVGGKRRLLEQFKLLNMLPPKMFNPNKSQYFEPFLGGGAVFFNLLPKNAFLSDVNFELITAYNEIKNNIEELIQNLKIHKVEKEYFMSLRDLDLSSLSTLEIASRFIYLNHTCYNGLYRVNKSGKFNVSFGRYINPRICDERNLRSVSKALQTVSIRLENYKSLLEHAKKGDFIYLDPPYDPSSKTSYFTSYTSQSFTPSDHGELKDLFVELDKKKCFVLLSNSGTPMIHDLYRNLNNVKIQYVTASRTINSNTSKRQRISEVLISNY